MMAKTMRRATYRPELTATFSLKELLKGTKRFATGGFIGPHITAFVDFWNLKEVSDPIGDLKKFHKLMLEESGLQWIEFGGFQFFMGRGGGKSLMSMRYVELFQQADLLHHRLAMQMVGPNLLRLKQRIHKRTMKKLKAKEMRPQRNYWRKQERLRNKRLPGR
jgi:hypothetical protein